MCGEIGEDTSINTEIHERLLAIARQMDVTTGVNSAMPQDLASAQGRTGYMDRIFSQGLEHALADVNGAAEDEKVDALACLAIALGRLSGFIAGNLPPDADLFKAVIDAVSTGHGEPGAIAAKMRAKSAGHHHHHDH